MINKVVILAFAFWKPKKLSNTRKMNLSKDTC